MMVLLAVLAAAALALCSVTGGDAASPSEASHDHVAAFLAWLDASNGA